MSFQEYQQGLEHISIKVTPLRLKSRAVNSLRHVLCPDSSMLEPISEKVELRDSDYSTPIKRILYAEAIRHR